MSNLDNPGVENIVNHILENNSSPITPQQVVDNCIEVLGPLEISDDTKVSLLEVASKLDRIESNGHSRQQKTIELIQELIRMIVSSKEYQFV